MYAHYIYKYKDAIYMYKDVGDANDSIFFMHLSLNGHLSCFHVLAIVNSAAMNIGMHVAFRIIVLIGCMPIVGLITLVLDFLMKPPYCFS